MASVNSDATKPTVDQESDRPRVPVTQNSVDSELGRTKTSCRSPHKKLRSFLSQVVAASSKYLIMLNIGMGISYSAIALPVLTDAKQGLSLTEDEGSWFASLVFIFQPVGSLATVPLSSVGRKKCMFYLQLPLFVGWLIPFFSYSVWELYLASSVMGLGIGFMQAPIATYIGEVTQPKYRGLLACTAYCFLTLGSVLVYAIDVLNGNWRHTALYCSLMPPITALLLYIIPESPVWLVSRGRYGEAKKALAWLRGWTDESQVDEEFKKILYHNSPQYATLVDSNIHTVSKDLELENTEPSTQNDTAKCDTSLQVLPVNEAETEKKVEHWNDIKKEEPYCRFLLRPEMWRPLLLSAVFLYMSNGIGVAVFRSYLVLIFKNQNVTIDEYIALIGVTTVGLIGNVLSVILMPVVGKRILSISGVLLSMIGCFGVGLYTTFASDIGITWILIALMVLIFFATNLGVGHIPWVLMSEIFPLRGRTLATGAVAGFGNFLQFLGTKLYPDYVNAMTISGTFYMYGGTFLLGAVYLYFFLFETEGKSLDEIVAEFRGNNKKQ